MEFQLFKLIFLLSIHGVLTKISFKISTVTPEIKLCYGTHPNWTIQVNVSVTKAELQNKYGNELEINLSLDNRNWIGICALDIGEGICPPPTIPNEFCYCANSGNDWYIVKVTRKAYLGESKAFLWISFQLSSYEPKLPVTILEQTCFDFRGRSKGVTTSGTIDAGDTWNAQGDLNIAQHRSNHGNLVQVKIDMSTFCTIDISQCPPTPLPTGDSICYCGWKSSIKTFYQYFLRVRGTAQVHQSRSTLSAELESTSGGSAITGIFGTLPTIVGRDGQTKSQGIVSPTISNIEKSTSKSQGTNVPIIPEQTTTKSHHTTEVNATELNLSNVLLIIIIFCLVDLCIAIAIYYYKKSCRASRLSPSKSEIPVPKSSERQKSQREQASRETDHTSTNKYSSHSHTPESISREGSSVDPASYGINSKLPSISPTYDSNTYQYSRVSSYNYQL